MRCSSTKMRRYLFHIHLLGTVNRDRTGTFHASDSQAVARDLKKISQSATVLEAEQEWENFAPAWGEKYPTIVNQWRWKWSDIIVLFDFPAAIRKAIDTTNVIESVNSVIRKSTRNRKQYPNGESAWKLVFLAIQKAAIAGLDDPEIPRRIRAKYQRRLEKLVACLRRCGFQCAMPGGTYFLYTRAPKAFAAGGPGGAAVEFENAEGVSQYLITQQSICTVPWDDAGPFLRFSVAYEAADEAAEDALMAETEARLKNIEPVF